MLDQTELGREPCTNAADHPKSGWTTARIWILFPERRPVESLFYGPSSPERFGPGPIAGVESAYLQPQSGQAARQTCRFSIPWFTRQRRASVLAS